MTVSEHSIFNAQTQARLGQLSGAMTRTLMVASVRAQKIEYRQRVAKQFGVPWAWVVDADHDEALVMDSWQQRMDFDPDDLAGGDVRPVETCEGWD